MPKFSVYAKKTLWILLAVCPLWNLFGQLTTDTGRDSLTEVRDLIGNVKAIHQDLIRGDFARLEVTDLRGRLQNCQVQNNSLESDLKTSRNREAVLSSELQTSKAETETERKAKRAAQWEVWLWRAGTAGLAAWKLISLIR